MPLTHAPTLTTDRLILRGPERGDLPAHVRFATTSDRMAAIGGRTTEDGAFRGFLAGIGHWHWHGYGFFTLTRRDDPAPLGRVGLLNLAGWADVELAWHLYDGAEGHGFATEAGAKVRDWARGTLGIDRLVSYIDAANARSQATARRLGAATDGARAAHDGDAEIWRHPQAGA
ncbi:acetyltransferase, gnat family [Oceaniovalibus guishaninsula JLT2003]|uniref:Acetyltransferase, gnat family n=1 Tax=Oceaniovalibus guishaninsula JLT2003 TaxID=1231392 RepID=K2GT27_9RHOB|nr:GNAT family N-acetyltransferase [Oceaniovalibus guishaninsula]EKE45681.1 acetyltransferase, gnat family [Oceaniovalibus guishaninsula JLT2003]